MSVQIAFRCPPEWADILPKPVPGAQGLPDWIRTMPTESHSEALDMAVRTVKHCPPFLDAMRGGWLMPLLCDVTVEPGLSFSWDWDLPVSSLDQLTRAPISTHVSAQLTGLPRPDEGVSAIKFNSAWTIEVPAGWSILVTHPANRLDLPFQTLSGVVDCDAFSHGFIHFPALWTDFSWTGTLPAGTPVAQIWPIPRAFETTVAPLSPSDIERVEDTLKKIGEGRGGYRKNFRKVAFPEE